MTKQGNWMICPICSGDGRHSRALGVVDPNDFAPDEWDEYMRGGYDTTCTVCNGDGKVRDNEETRQHVRSQHQWEAGVNEAGERFAERIM